MELPLYQVDAFTDRLFAGNPAAVCPLPRWLKDETMQSIAAENNLAETAFFLAEGEGFRLRWFTPTVEIDLCGHATLASAFVISSFLEPSAAPDAFRDPQRAADGDPRGRFLSARFPGLGAEARPQSGGGQGHGAGSQRALRLHPLSRGL